MTKPEYIQKVNLTKVILEDDLLRIGRDSQWQVVLMDEISNELLSGCKKFISCETWREIDQNRVKVHSSIYVISDIEDFKKDYAELALYRKDHAAMLAENLKAFTEEMNNANPGVAEVQAVVTDV